MNGAVIICYDIACDRRRYRVARILLAYGERVLESVFECRIGHATLLDLQARLAKIITEEDKLAYWEICGHDFQDRYCQGKQVFEEDAAYFIY
jgi:CRISPR-associated protein Cas2